ncbi:MAG TPA: VIT1/CCC1 transporter family protein [Candidatus Saccharimonadales bacterium]
MNATDRKKDSAVLALRAAQVQRGGARAAVLGVNDGLVSTLCITLGVAAASGSKEAVLLAGFAGLIAGAISMAAGEWISVQSQVDLFKGVLKDVKRLVKTDEQLILDELEKDLEADGMSKTTAMKATKEIAQNKAHLYDNFVSHVIGINKDELGSPWVAAVSSFLLFTAGSIVALAPWFFGGGTPAITLSIIFTALGGLVVGGYVASSSGDSVAKGALRQLLIIILASVVTYGVGYLFGTVV